MTVSLTRVVPAQLVAGDSLEVLVPIPSDLAGWTGSARLTGAGTTMNATSVVTENADFHVKFEGQSAGGTKALPAGAYTLTVWATSGNDRQTVAQHRISIMPDLSTGTPALEHAVKMLGIIETALENRLQNTVDGAIEEYEVNGRKIVKLSTPQLRALRVHYAAEVSRLQNPDAPIGRVLATFGPAGFTPQRVRRY